MAKSDEKKKKKTQERITELEEFLRQSLIKKDSVKTEIDVGKIMRQIEELKLQL
jgi:hypothetical protein